MFYKINSQDGEISLKLNPILPKIIVISSIYLLVTPNALHIKIISLLCLTTSIYFEYKAINLLKSQVNFIVKQAFQSGTFVTDNYNSLQKFQDKLKYIKNHGSKLLGTTSGKIDRYNFIYKNTEDDSLKEFFIFKDCTHIIFINQKPNSNRVRNICKIPKGDIQDNNGILNIPMLALKKYYITQQDFYYFFDIIKNNPINSAETTINVIIE